MPLMAGGRKKTRPAEPGAFKRRRQVALARDQLPELVDERLLDDELP